MASIRETFVRLAQTSIPLGFVRDFNEEIEKKKEKKTITRYRVHAVLVYQ